MKDMLLGKEGNTSKPATLLEVKSGQLTSLEEAEPNKFLHPMSLGDTKPIKLEGLNTRLDLNIEPKAIKVDIRQDRPLFSLDLTQVDNILFQECQPQEPTTPTPQEEHMRREPTRQEDTFSPEKLTLSSPPQMETTTTTLEDTL